MREAIVSIEVCVKRGVLREVSLREVSLREMCVKRDVC